MPVSPKDKIKLSKIRLRRKHTMKQQQLKELYSLKVQVGWKLKLVSLWQGVMIVMRTVMMRRI